MFLSKALLSVYKPLLISIILFTSVVGNPITRRQFSELKKRLEKAAEELKSGDKEADILIQEKYEEKNVTYYRGEDKSLPVFISYGLNNIAKKIHVLLRGEDYLNPQDEHTFVVLKESGDPNQYTVHSAYIENLASISNTTIQWFSNLIEQKKNVRPLLAQMGNTEVQARSLRSSRPMCDWLGFLLLCDTPKDVAPIRKENRGETETMDEEDSEPIQEWMTGSSDEESSDKGGGVKAKRQLPANSGPKLVPTPKSGGSSSSSKTSSHNSVKQKVQVKAEATKNEVSDNSLGNGKVDEEKVVGKQDKETSPPGTNENQEGRSFGSYQPKKQNEEKKKHRKKHRKHNNRD